VGYKYLDQPAAAELVVSKSRFLAQLFPVAGPEAAKERVAAVRKAHFSARHHATAMVLGPDGQVQRSNDDGEPAGTAGLPMLEVLRRRQVTDTLAVVTRYFGGILLGAGGLVRAYGGATALALDQAHLVAKVRCAIVELTAPAGQAGKAEGQIRRFVDATPGAALEDVTYGERVTWELVLTGQADQALAQLLAAGGIGAACTRTGYKLATIAP
jgi:uncharacterized YigZ family protein